MLSSINGYKIVESIHATEPRIRLSEYVIVSDEFRKQENKWLEDLFGRVPAAYVVPPNTMFVHPELVHKLGNMT